MADSGSAISASNRGQKIELDTKFASIALQAENDSDLSILREYGDFWKIPFTVGSELNRGSVLFSSGIAGIDHSRNFDSIIVSVRCTTSAGELAERFGATLSINETVADLQVSHDTSLSLATKLYRFSGGSFEESIKDRANSLLYKIRDSNIYILALDLVAEYRRLMYQRMDETPNWKFRLLTRLPFSYGLIPSFLRNRAFKTKGGFASPRDEALCPVEFLRSLFLASLAVGSRYPIPTIGFWRQGKSYALAVTHDVETQLGLEDRADRLMRVESELGIRSSWNVPSDRYPLSSQLLMALAANGELGGHDTKHDGRLLFASSNDKLERTRHCKEKLETLSRSKVRGFRAPLLQHSRDLVEALGRAGFDHDSSMPSWEPLSPTSLKAHGVGTVFPFMISGLVEIPVSLPQDHQLIRAGSLDVSGAVDQLLDVSKRIKSLGGACVLLVHPDYEFSEEESLNEYRRLLSSFSSDPYCDIMTLGELARWWRYRHDSSIDEDGNVIFRLGDKEVRAVDLPLTLITGYGKDGFEVQPSTSIVEIPENRGSRS